MHFDFKEILTVVLPEQVQAYHGHKRQVSVVTVAATTGKSTRAFAVISDDMYYDDVYACFAIVKIKDLFNNNDPVHSQVTYVSDSAAGYFNNRYSCTN